MRANDGDSMNRQRYLRQILLAEIGTEGQAALERAHLCLSGETLAHDVATLYALRAGVGSVGNGEVPLDALAPVELCGNLAARQVLAGSRAAVRALLSAAGNGQTELG